MFSPLDLVQVLLGMNDQATPCGCTRIDDFGGHDAVDIGMIDTPLTGPTRQGCAGYHLIVYENLHLVRLLAQRNSADWAAHESARNASCAGRQIAI